MSKVDLFVHTSLYKIGHFTCNLGWCPVSYIMSGYEKIFRDDITETIKDTGHHPKLHVKWPIFKSELWTNKSTLDICVENFISKLQ